MFYSPNRSPSLTICTVLLMHKPTTLCCHGNIFGYVVAYSFAYIMVSVPFLRNVPIIRYNTFKYNYSQICGILLSKLQALYMCTKMSRHSERDVKNHAYCKGLVHDRGGWTVSRAPIRTHSRNAIASNPGLL